jgi:hypothetical protein
MFVCVPGGTWRREDDWVSRCYGAREAAPVFIYSRTDTGPQEFVTFLMPRRAREEEKFVRETKAQGGRAFEVRGGSARDRLLLASDVQVQTENILSDGRWTWMRFAEDGALQEFVALDVSRIEICGQMTLHIAPVGWLYGCRAGKGWKVRTDAQENEFHVWH